MPDAVPYLETSRWLLTSSTDPHGNLISYPYARDSLASAPASGCGHIAGTVDCGAWPTEVRWGANAAAGSADRYQVRLVSSAHANDTAFEGADHQFRDDGGAPRETRRRCGVAV